MAENLLEIRNVSKTFRIGGMLSRKKLTAIDDVSLTITNERPVILSIVGVCKRNAKKVLAILGLVFSFITGVFFYILIGVMSAFM